MSLVGIGSANAGAFTNFEVGDVKSLAGSLDLNLLKAKNSISSLVTSGSLNGNSTLLNVGAGVNFTAYADFGGSLLTLAQATAGALTVSLNVDDTVVDHLSPSEMWIEATNATSLTAVFDSSSLFSTPALQTETIDLTGDVATSLAIVSGGTNADNVLNYTYGEVDSKGLLTSVTVTGTQNLALELNGVGASPLNSRITNINASALTGDLTADLKDLKAGGTLSLGTGDDQVTGQAGTTIADINEVVVQERLVSGFEKATAEDLATQNGFDILNIGTAVQAADHTAADSLDYTVKNGLLTFGGSGARDIFDAVSIAEGALGANTALAFVYNSISYVLEEGNTSDLVLIQLTGTTGLVGLDNVTGHDGSLYVF